ncbi:MAG: FAD-dependent oxidoreductase [Opitutales bacterium]|nr:FAD-dependent oxidoreductase [Opitutales bacterium]
MNRREFLRLCQLLGLTLSTHSVLRASKATQRFSDKHSTPVVIIGAGAAGLSAGYLLKQLGIDFKILEASSIHGGRMKHTTEFANFPIPLGAEWIHVEPKILKEIVNDDSVRIDINTRHYDPDVDYVVYEGERLSLREAGFTKESKFINSTWFDFYERYILGSIKSHITYNSIVDAIDYSDDICRVRAKDKVYEASQVIVTIPVKRLQMGAITFNPRLPSKKQKAIEKVRVWSGCKAFIEFSEKFYPVLVEYKMNPETAGQKLYYDAAYGQNTSQNILGLFAVGSAAQPYLGLNDNELVAYILDELDKLFGHNASGSYIKHVFQNWDADPFANGAYVVDHENWRVVRRLGKAVDNRLFFAGDAYTDGDDWSSVHTAARSAKRAVESILENY